LSRPATPPMAVAPARNPYRGLEAFEQADSDDFYGRERSVAEMVAVLRHEPLLIVVGPSGIGKSSAVKAGLVPVLTTGAIPGSDSWLVTEMVPGRDPFELLATALDRIASRDAPDVVAGLVSGDHTLGEVLDELAPGHAGVLVVIDQLEELFTQTFDELERRAFVRMLVDVANTPGSAVRVVCTLRADYFDRPLAHPGFDDAIHGRTVALGAMSPDELADAVRLPASAVGVEVEPQVVDRIVAEAELHPGALPLVQHTLSELFRTRSTNSITVADLDALGGVFGAIGRRAEQIYTSFDDRCRTAGEVVFLRLVSVTEDSGDTRRRVRRTELEQTGIGSDELDGHHRLLTFDRDPASRTPTVELAHEAILTDWERYARWVDDARDDLLARRRVEAATRDWIQAGRDSSFLYSGGRLELAQAWAGETRFQLGDDERRFLDESRAKVDRDRVARSRRRRVVVTVLALAAVVAMVMAVIAFVQRQDADDQADETRSRELAGLATQAIDEDPERAILLGLAALERSDHTSPEVLSALHRATQSMRLISAEPDLMSTSLAQSPDGSMLAADHLDGVGFVVIDTASGNTIADITTESPLGEFALAFDPTGSTLAVGLLSEDESQPAVQLFDLVSGAPTTSLPGASGLYGQLQYDSSGRWVAGLRGPLEPAEWDAVVWDTSAGGTPTEFGTASDLELVGTTSLAVLPWSGDGLRVFDLSTGELVRQVATPNGVEYWDVEVDQAGQLAALVSPLAGRVDVIDFSTGEVRGTLSFREPNFAQFSPDGSALAVAGSDSLVRLYDTDRFVETMRLSGTTGGPFHLLFAPDGSRLVSARTGEIRTWDISPGGPSELGNFHVDGGLLDRLAVAGDESVAYATVHTNAGRISSVHHVDKASGADDEVLADVRYYFSTRPLVSPDLSVMAAPDANFVTSLVRLPDGPQTPLGRCESVRAFDQTGRLAAVDGHLVCEEVFGEPGTASRIMDLESGGTVLDLGDAVVYAAAFGPPAGDGRPSWAIVEDRNTIAVTLYDLTTGNVVGTYVPEADFAVSLAASPDGRRFALLMDSGRLLAFDPARIREGEDPSDAIVFDVAAHNAGSKAVAISESGLVATGSSADGVRVWSAEGELVASVPTHQDDAPTFTFAPGTDTLYYEDGDGVVRRFKVDVDDVTRLARSVLTRGFTERECARYFADEPCPTPGA
jgi:WD40 repeat protein